jgi:hypothetical protein
VIGLDVQVGRDHAHPEREVRQDAAEAVLVGDLEGEVDRDGRRAASPGSPGDRDHLRILESMDKLDSDAVEDRLEVVRLERE